MQMSGHLLQALDPPLILKSGACAASRRMKARMPASWFETALRASSP